ncbi:MAG: hypothetical protein HY894_09485 [Deltaproteobacteria bacterium]|nr:hypothetical protein [Deltaproteobacteria bacterium]
MFFVLAAVFLLTAQSHAGIVTVGELDPSFGTLGKVRTTFGGNNDYAYAVAIQPDGKIVVAGNSCVFAPCDFAVVRYNANGSLDASFGVGGKVTTDVGAGDDDYAYAVGIQSDGKILAAGFITTASGWDSAIVRYNSDGSLDTSFGAGGKATLYIGGDTWVSALAVQSDGKIIAVGGGSNGANYDITVVRYISNGTLDASFGTGGIVQADRSAG